MLLNLIDVTRTWIGTTLYEACESNEVELGPMSIGGPSEIVHSEKWTEPVFGSGPTSGYDVSFFLDC